MIQGYTDPVLLNREHPGLYQEVVAQQWKHCVCLVSLIYGYAGTCTLPLLCVPGKYCNFNVCDTYSLSSLPSPTNASFASSMAQEISLFRKSLQEKSFLIKKPCNITMTPARGEGKRTCCSTSQLWCGHPKVSNLL